LDFAKAFAKQVPSTYQQYYVNSFVRWQVMSEDNHLLWYLIKKAERNNIDTTISKSVWDMMKAIEAQINRDLLSN
jgi:hypothetical protein